MKLALQISNQTNVYDSNLQGRVRFIEKVSAEANRYKESKKVEYLAVAIPMEPRLKASPWIELAVPHVQETSLDPAATQGLLSVEHLVEVEIKTPFGVDNFSLELPVHLTKTLRYMNSDIEGLREGRDLEKKASTELPTPRPVWGAPPIPEAPPAYEAAGPLYSVPRDPSMAIHNEYSSAPAQAASYYEMPPAYQSVGLQPIPLSPAQRFQRTASVLTEQAPRVHVPAEIRRISEERARVGGHRAVALPEMPLVPDLPIMPQVPVHLEPAYESPRRAQTSHFQV